MSSPSFRIDLFHHIVREDVDSRLDELLTHVKELQAVAKTIAEMQALIQEKVNLLTAKVDEETSIGTSIVVLLNNIATDNAMLKGSLADAIKKIEEGADASVLQPLVDAIDAQSAALDKSKQEITAAVLKNTPAEPPAGGTTPA